jgi:hypothetical protein
MRPGPISILAMVLCCASTPLAAQQQPQPARPSPGISVSNIGKLAFAERPQRSTDQDQETLALQLVDSLGLACRGHEMYRWKFAEDDPDRAQQIVAAGERSLKDKGYTVSTMPVEIDTQTALMARHPNRNQPDAIVLALYYASDQGVDLTLCRVRDK